MVEKNKYNDDGLQSEFIHIGNAISWEDACPNLGVINYVYV